MVSPSSTKLARASQQGEQHTSMFLLLPQEKQKERKGQCWTGAKVLTLLLLPKDRNDAPGKGPSPQHKLSLATLPSPARLSGLWSKQHREQDCAVLLESVIW